jgi:hypothetical protein
MNLFGFYLITLVLATNSFAQNSNEITNATDFKKLQQELLSLKELMAQDTVLHTEAIPLELDIRRQVDNIYLDMNTRLPGGNGKLTPEWKEFTQQLAEALEPHEEIILEAAYRPLVDKNRKKTQLNRLTFNADQLIGFLKPDHEVEILMRQKLVQYPTLRWQIYRHLHELRLLRGTDVKDMEALGSEISDPNEKIKWAEEVSFYGSDAGLDIFENLLSVPFDPAGAKNERGEPETNQSFLNYSPALRGIVNLGIKAEILRPLLEARTREMREFYISNFGEEVAHRFLIGLDIIKMALNGESPAPYASARNRSGLLYPPGQGATDKSPLSSETDQSGSEPLRQDKKQPNMPLADNSNVVNNTQWWVWTLVLFGVTLAIAFVTLKRIGSRSSKPYRKFPGK